MSQTQKPPTIPCETCGKTMVPIAYGYPGAGMMEADERGEVVLGGCCVEQGLPLWRCLTCGAEAGSLSFAGE